MLLSLIRPQHLCRALGRELLQIFEFNFPTSLARWNLHVELILFICCFCCNYYYLFFTLGTK